ncbi:hypothetical protein Agub_g5192, partial [Astrephomene gubernaculifera]
MGNLASTPLHKAANDKDLSKLRWEVQQHPTLVNSAEPTMSWTPLHVAANNGAAVIVRELLARGARHDVADKDGRTPLHLAAHGGHSEAVRDLLRAGAAASARDKSGASPYDYAVKERHSTVAALLGGPPPPAPLPPSQQQLPYQGPMPPVDLTSAAPAAQLLPPLPPPAAPMSTGLGGVVIPKVHHDRTPQGVLLPPPPATPGPLPASSYPAGPTTAAAGGGGYGGFYESPSAPPAPYDTGACGYGGAAQQQQQQPYNTPAYVPYPAVPGRQQPAATAAPPPVGGAAWPGGGGGVAAVQNQPYAPPPLPTPAQQPQRGGSAGSGSGGGKAADLDWAPTARTDWGDEADQPPPPPPSSSSAPASRPANWNPIQSARYQLERLLGAGLAQLGLSGSPGSSSAAAAAAAASPSMGGASTLSSSSSSSSGRVYSYQQLYAATGGFSAGSKLGEGGYGPVYRGTLDGIPVAVKVMDCGEGAMQGRSEFEAEVRILSALHHPHVVLLIGSCPEKGMLVYELMSRGSLAEHLFSQQHQHQQQQQAAGRAWPWRAGGRGSSEGGGQQQQQQQHPQRQQQAAVHLDWRDRVRISAEVASALLFLHSAPTPIVHMDLKPANILLDEHLTAKLGDVGLARLAPTLAAPAGPAAAAAAERGQGRPPGRSTVQDDRLVGTWEYMDPEYLRSGEFSARSDVYALGVVLLQLLTGRQGAQVISQVESARQQPLSFVEACIDPRVGSWPAAEAMAFADLALRCVEYRRQDRPDLRNEILPTLLQLRQRTTLYDPLPQQPPLAQRQQQPQWQQQQQPGALANAGGEAVPPMFVCPITQVGSGSGKSQRYDKEEKESDRVPLRGRRLWPRRALIRARMGGSPAVARLCRLLPPCALFEHRPHYRSARSTLSVSLTHPLCSPAHTRTHAPRPGCDGRPGGCCGRLHVRAAGNHGVAGPLPHQPAHQHAPAAHAAHRKPGAAQRHTGVV